MQLEQAKLEITACNFFNIDKSLLFTVSLQSNSENLSAEIIFFFRFVVLFFLMSSLLFSSIWGIFKRIQIQRQSQIYRRLLKNIFKYDTTVFSFSLPINSTVKHRSLFPVLS
jgi:uncharacterized membrane protein SpoIIM required for sporulation